jgi:hypothetical protein
VVLVENEPACEAVTEQVPPASVLDVEALRVAAVQLAHPVGEVLPGALHDQVVVRAHQAEGVDIPRERLHHLEQERQEQQAIVVV